MRRRIGDALAIGIATCLGGWGCASAPVPRVEAPARFRQWNTPGGTAQPQALGRPQAQGKVATQARPVGAESSATAKTAATTASTPRYKPGSILFRRFRKAEPTSPPALPEGEAGGEAKDSLARYFPGLYGKGQGDAARLVRARRPEAGTGPAGEPARTDRAVAAASAPARESAAQPPYLPVGLPVLAFPKAPSPSLPPAEALARRDEPNPEPGPSPDPASVAATEPLDAPKVEATGERLASNESPEPNPSVEVPATVIAATAEEPGADLIDGLGLDLTPSPSTAAPTAEVDAPSDPAGRPAAVIVERPGPDSRVVPPVPAPAGPEVKPESRPSPFPEPATPAPSGGRKAGAPVESSLPRTSPDANPVLAGRPRLPAVGSMPLPPPEFPRTYHSESVNRVLKQANDRPATANTQPSSSPTPTTTMARRSILRDLFAPRTEAPPAQKANAKAEAGTADREVRPSSKIGPDDGATGSGRAEPRRLAKRRGLFQGVTPGRVDEPSER